MKLHRPATLTLLGTTFLCLGFAFGCASKPQTSAKRPTLETARTGLPVEPGAADKLGYVPNWATDIGLGNSQHLRSAHVLDQLGLVITIEKPTNLVSAISLDDGSIRWQRVLGKRGEALYGGLAVDDSRLFFNNKSRAYVLDAKTGKDGSLSNLKSTVVGPPAIYQGLAIFGGLNGQIFAHDVSAGFAKWSYQLTGTIQTSPVVQGNTVLAADSRGVYAALRASSGKELWRSHTWDAVSAQPAAGISDVYVPSVDRSLYAINRTTGEDHWIYRVNQPLRKGPTVIGRYVFQPVPGDGLHVLGADEGKRLWKFPTAATPITLRGKHVLLKTAGRGLALVDLDTGRTKTQVTTKPMQTVESGPKKCLIAVATTGQILRLNPEK